MAPPPQWVHPRPPAASPRQRQLGCQRHRPPARALPGAAPPAARHAGTCRGKGGRAGGSFSRAACTHAAPTENATSDTAVPAAAPACRGGAPATGTQHSPTPRQHPPLEEVEALARPRWIVSARRVLSTARPAAVAEGKRGGCWAGACRSGKAGGAAATGQMAQRCSAATHRDAQQAGRRWEVGSGIKAGGERAAGGLRA